MKSKLLVLASITLFSISSFPNGSIGVSSLIIQLTPGVEASISSDLQFDKSKIYHSETGETLLEVFPVTQNDFFNLKKDFKERKLGQISSLENKSYSLSFMPDWVLCNEKQEHCIGLIQKDESESLYQILESLKYSRK